MNSSLHANGDQVGGEKREAKRDGEFVFQAALFGIIVTAKSFGKWTIKLGSKWYNIS
jgi:hypothetical protein